MDDNWVLQVKDVSKAYGDNPVLNKVNLSLKRGEIHALVGENGAGKSTLMNILFGMPVIHETGGFTGEVWLKGRKSEIKSPKDAMDAGIGMVHQEFMLLPGFSVAENVKLNREPTKPNWFSKVAGPKFETINLHKMGYDTRQALDRIEIGVDEWLPLMGMPVGHRQFIEIAREIDKTDLSLIVLDEPTAVLTETESSRLLSALNKLAGSGIGVLFISHRLDEVFEIADTITVLRDGEVICTVPKHEARVENIAEMMVGRKISNSKATQPGRTTGNGNILEIRNLSVDMPGEYVNGVDLNVRKGEILGIGGLAGHGKLGIANGLMGLCHSAGTVMCDSQEIPLNDSRAALDAGLVFLSEDRRGVGLLLDESIEDNIALASVVSRNKFVKKVGPLPISVEDGKSIREHAREMISLLDIKCTGPQQSVRRLSGGNQQKVCVAKAITMEPEVLLVSEPTRGIDVGAKERVLSVIKRLNAEKGITVVMTSSELAELRSMCDRIAIMYNGKIHGILSPDAPDAEFGFCMAGGGGVPGD
ncbi:MAG TPA: sugar ABC transporter ATP-binding protein [Firmicutes bacterium]|nr:sugar ABC transporter ATP-binding protein [Candidatus Fermentithermobacillaceae bacterium]